MIEGLFVLYVFWKLLHRSFAASHEELSTKREVTNHETEARRGKTWFYA